MAAAIVCSMLGATTGCPALQGGFRLHPDVIAVQRRRATRKTAGGNMWGRYAILLQTQVLPNEAEKRYILLGMRRYERAREISMLRYRRSLRPPPSLFCTDNAGSLTVRSRCELSPTTTPRPPMRRPAWRGVSESGRVEKIPQLVFAWQMKAWTTADQRICFVLVNC